MGVGGRRGKEAGTHGSRSQDLTRAVLVLAILSVCAFVLQGCDYFSDPDEVSQPPPRWQPPKLNHSAESMFFIDYERIAKDCTGEVLKDAMGRTSIAFRTELEETMPEAVPVDVRDKHLNRIFPKDIWKYFVLDETTGFMNKERVYCRLKYYFSDLRREAFVPLLLEEVQGQLLRFTQFTKLNAHDAMNVTKDAAGRKAVARLYGVEDLSGDMFDKLRKSVIELQRDFHLSLLYQMDSFAQVRWGTEGCLMHFFEEVLENTKCYWEPGYKQGAQEPKVVFKRRKRAKTQTSNTTNTPATNHVEAPATLQFKETPTAAPPKPVTEAPATLQFKETPTAAPPKPVTEAPATLQFKETPTAAPPKPVTEADDDAPKPLISNFTGTRLAGSAIQSGEERVPVGVLAHASGVRTGGAPGRKDGVALGSTERGQGSSELVANAADPERQPGQGPATAAMKA